MNKFAERIREYIRKRENRVMLRRAMLIMASIVVFVTTYSLVLPAITMEKEAICGLEEHPEHTDECYTLILDCGQEEHEAHKHTDECYKEETVLSCDKEEHTHEESCYDEEGNLICELEEHTHDDSCYSNVRTDELICGLEETDGHKHSDACYRKELTCGKEIHQHSKNCYAQEEDRSDDAAAEEAAKQAAEEEAARQAAEEEAAKQEEQNDAEEDDLQDVADAGNGSSDDLDLALDIDEEGNAAEEGAAEVDGNQEQKTKKEKKKDKEEKSDDAAKADDGTAAEPKQDPGVAGVTEAITEAAPLPALIYENILANNTGLWYETAEGTWERVTDTTTLYPTTKVVVRFAVSMKTNSLDAGNAVVKGELPEQIRLTKKLAQKINDEENRLNRILSGTRLPGEVQVEDEYKLGTFTLKKNKETGRWNITVTFNSYAIETNASTRVKGWFLIEVTGANLQTDENGYGSILFRPEMGEKEELRVSYTVAEEPAPETKAEEAAEAKAENTEPEKKDDAVSSGDAAEADTDAEGTVSSDAGTADDEDEETIIFLSMDEENAEEDEDPVEANAAEGEAELAGIEGAAGIFSEAGAAEEEISADEITDEENSGEEIAEAELSDEEIADAVISDAENADEDEAEDMWR